MRRRPRLERSGEQEVQRSPSSRFAEKLVGSVRPSLSAVGVLSGNNQNLYLMMIDDTGQVTLPQGLIAGGQGIAGARLFWTGEDFAVFWLQSDNEGIQQVFTTRVACE